LKLSNYTADVTDHIAQPTVTIGCQLSLMCMCVSGCLQALMGLPGSLPIGMPVNFQNMGMLGGFPQMWATAAGQQYAGGLPVVNASQLHELYGGVNGGVEGPPPAHIQQPSSAAGDTQSSALYR